MPGRKKVITWGVWGAAVTSWAMVATADTLNWRGHLLHYALSAAVMFTSAGILSVLLKIHADELTAQLSDQVGERVDRHYQAIARDVAKLMVTGPPTPPWRSLHCVDGAAEPRNGAAAGR